MIQTKIAETREKVRKCLVGGMVLFLIIGLIGFTISIIGYIDAHNKFSSYEQTVLQVTNYTVSNYTCDMYGSCFSGYINLRYDDINHCQSSNVISDLESSDAVIKYLSRKF